MRVWIEIWSQSQLNTVRRVTLCVRVWIEIFQCCQRRRYGTVTLCVRVWIEITGETWYVDARFGHPLREGVD